MSLDHLILEWVSFALDIQTPTVELLNTPKYVEYAGRKRHRNIKALKGQLGLRHLPSCINTIQESLYLFHGRFSRIARLFPFSIWCKRV